MVEGCKCLSRGGIDSNISYTLRSKNCRRFTSPQSKATLVRTGVGGLAIEVMGNLTIPVLVN